MDGIALQDLVLFSAATLAASLIAGLAGFAFGLVAAAIWLHVLTPLQTTSLIVAFGLVVQGLSVWRLRRALRFRPPVAVPRRRRDRCPDRRRALALG
jgi:uncharacterized protein